MQSSLSNLRRRVVEIELGEEQLRKAGDMEYGRVLALQQT